MVTKGTVYYKHMKLLSIVIYVLTCSIGFCQEVNWSQTKNWKIYAVNSNSAFNYPLDSFQNRKSVSLNDSVVISFFSRSILWPKAQYAHWMGMYYGSYQFANGQQNKVVFSAYGGFFFDSNSKRYYELTE